MTDPSAMQVALLISAHPTHARDVRNLPLPLGVTDLLRVAIGDERSLASLSRALGRSPSELRQAAGFFIEQAMLTSPQDSYRVLGTRADATHAELRQNMALLMRWLHPDVLQGDADDGAAVRAVFANRVSQAWEDLKSPERRQTYDKSLSMASHMNAPSRTPRVIGANGAVLKTGRHASHRDLHKDRHALVHRGSMPPPDRRRFSILDYLHTLLRGRR